MEPVAMAQLPTIASCNLAGTSTGAGPAAEGSDDGPIAHRLRPSRKPAGYYTGVGCLFATDK